MRLFGWIKDLKEEQKQRESAYEARMQAIRDKVQERADTYYKKELECEIAEAKKRASAISTPHGMAAQIDHMAGARGVYRDISCDVSDIETVINHWVEYIKNNSHNFISDPLDRGIVIFRSSTLPITDYTTETRSFDIGVSEYLAKSKEANKEIAEIYKSFMVDTKCTYGDIVSIMLWLINCILHVNYSWISDSIGVQFEGLGYLFMPHGTYVNYEPIMTCKLY